MSKAITNVLFAGIGGQGIILASDLLSEMASANSTTAGTGAYTKTSSKPVPSVKSKSSSRSEVAGE